MGNAMNETTEKKRNRFRGPQNIRDLLPEVQARIAERQKKAACPGAEAIYARLRQVFARFAEIHGVQVHWPCDATTRRRCAEMEGWAVSVAEIDRAIEHLAKKYGNQRLRMVSRQFSPAYEVADAIIFLRRRG